MQELALQISIAFFGTQVVAWAGLCGYLRLTHRRRIEQAIGSVLSDAEPVAQAA